MSQDDLPITLDDSAIRGAVRAAWGGGAASPDLRRRTMMAMTRAVLEEPGIAESTRSPRFWDRWPAPVRVGSAVAALLVLAVGATWGLLELEGWRASASLPPRTYVRPPVQQTLYEVLVSRHDDFSAGAEAPEQAVPANRLAEVRQALAGQVGQGVWAPDLTKQGWSLAGVRVYTVNGVAAVAFNYRRGTDEVSAFSLPVSHGGGEACPGSMPDVDLVLGNRSFASFMLEGEMFAMVGSRGSGPLPLAELRGMVNQYRDDPSCRAGCGFVP